ncbi:MAG: serine hydroxymethyltransferase, partial [Candidatus Micrarchaeales archaeon]
TGQLFNSVPYHVKPDGYIDIEEVRRLAMEKKPKLIWIGATAYTRELPFEEFSKIADECGAYLVADVSHISGLIIAGAHKSPVDYVHIVMTTTHKTLRGPRGAMIMVTERGLKKDPELGEKIDKTIFPGMQGGPHNHITAGIAVALLEASTPQFREYGQQIVKNSKALADELMKKGAKLVTNGTENHMILMDLTQFGKGKGVLVQDALDAANITMNKNTIPNDPASPFYPSGVRMGTPAITTRGMKEPEMRIIAGFIIDVVLAVKDYQIPEGKEERQAYIKKFKEDIQSNEKIVAVRGQVKELSSRFPLYPGLNVTFS